MATITFKRLEYWIWSAEVDLMLRKSVRLWALMTGITMAPIVAVGDEGSGADEARDILRKARVAIKSAKVLTYEADYRVTGFVTQWIPNITGKVVIGGKSEEGVERFFCKVEARQEGSEEVVARTAGCNGDEYFLIDDKTKTVHVDMDPAVLGSNGREVRRAILSELNMDEPFKEELEADEITLMGTERVGAEECHKIHVKRSSPAEQTWWISKKDHLPRRTLRLYRRGDDEGTTELVLNSLAVNPKFERDPFRIRVPTGYTKTDEFAP